MSNVSRSSTMSPAAERFVWPVRVYYEDTDAGGVVFYANYLRFMERARTEWLRALGFDQARLMDEDGLVFAVRSVRVEYLRPARLDDRLEITAAVARKGRASLLFEQTVERPRDAQASELLCRGEVKIACLDAHSFRPVSVPQDILQALSASEAMTRER